MKILGIDYGRAKIGLALSESSWAGPWKVIRVKGREDMLLKIEQIVKTEEIEQVIVGVAEGEMGKEQEQFVQELARKITVPVEMQDETLSTQDAQLMIIQSGISRKKRHDLEDAYAAAIMLQSWLDAQSA